MQWSKDKREKLARMIKARSEEIKQNNLGDSDEHSYTDKFDRNVLEFLKPLGFRRSHFWQIESNESILMLRESPTHLWFHTIDGLVVVISKEQAEKILVLGLPG
jgi:hypothetical protein